MHFPCCLSKHYEHSSPEMREIFLVQILVVHTVKTCFSVNAALDLRGCFISDSALYEVTQLTTLKSLSIEPFWELPIPPQTNFMFSSFSSLTHLGLVGDSVTVEMIAVGMVYSTKEHAALRSFETKSICRSGA